MHHRGNQYASVTGFFGTHRFSEGENCWSGRGWCKSATNIHESVHSTIHCEPCHHPIQEQSQGDCRSPFWSSLAINKMPQKPSEISGEGTLNLSH